MSDGAQVSPDTQFAELMSQMRHLGGLRFTMLGIFLVFTAGLLALRFGTTDPLTMGVAVKGPWLFTAVGLVFVTFELQASFQYAELASRARALEGDQGALFNGREIAALGPVTVSTCTLYVLVVIFWWVA